MREPVCSSSGISWPLAGQKLPHTLQTRLNHQHWLPPLVGSPEGLIVALRSPERAENTKLDLHTPQCFPDPKSRSCWGPAKGFLKSQDLTGSWLLSHSPAPRRGQSPQGSQTWVGLDSLGKGTGGSSFSGSGQETGLNKPPRLPPPALAVSQSDGPPPKCADTGISQGGILEPECGSESPGGLAAVSVRWSWFPFLMGPRGHSCCRFREHMQV